MNNKISNKKIYWIIAHILIGILATFSYFPLVYSSFSILVFIFYIVKRKNINEEAGVFAAYIVGSEVFLRMTKGYFFYETGKYYVIILLMIGVFVGHFKQKFSIHYILYILLLLLGIVFTQVPEGQSIRNSIVFNLSGPVLLGISAIYFYHRPVSKKELYNILFFMLLPLISTITFLYFRTPELSEIIFGTSANFETSGGFGPNQVATAIGLGVVIITIFIVSKEKLSGFLLLDFCILTYFIYRGLLTFSRGGIFTAVISLLFFLFFFFLYKKISGKLLLKYISIILFFIFAIWIYTSEVTGGMLDNRYAGQNALGVQKKDISTGRIAIFEVQVINFFNNPLGIGVGNGKFEREKIAENISTTSHNEVGRLIEEHGFIGLSLLIMLLTIPILIMSKSNNFQKAFIGCFYLIWFLTINHSAMRIAMPGFIYALSLIKITNIED
ncbi:O-antigen ligase family protein [uncultured Polaribacter sp.]|uniref:O-antigen ligase family protein n=1 Tax=uncultured Polaribacter sp. TaxID=174711 RepID=UPI002606C95A|nr:O-antigen ligase family protein [uncultured Polaribacter sp.]